MPPKKPTTQFYADECFPVTSVTFLRSLGYSIIHALDLKMQSKPDATHMKTSRKLKRILITIDRDFLYYSEASLENHPGVIVFSLSDMIPENINKISRKLLKEITQDFTKEAIVTVSNDKLIKKKEGQIVFEKYF